MVEIKIKNLVKTFGEVTAVKNLNLDIEDGEFVVLLGPSGCGKTTTLRCICGLETPDEGDIILGDERINDLPPKDRNMAMVFQNYALYPHLNVTENLMFPLKNLGFPEKERNERVMKAAELLQIEKLLNREVSELSGGQQQRVALGRAIVRDPECFLLDEPLSNLDAKLRLEMRGELKKIQQDLGTTTIYVTHDQEEAMTLADRIAVIKDGEVRQFSDKQDLYDKPEDEFVARFVGSPPINFWDCSIIEKNGGTYLEGENFEYELSSKIFQEIKERIGKSEIRIGVRPEDVEITNPTAKNAQEGKLYVTEELGNERIVKIQSGDQLLNVSTTKSIKVEPGDKIYFSFNESSIHFFRNSKNLKVYQ